MPFVVGENIGPYRLIEQLGQGGMATVYKAYHAALDRYVAIKVMHPAFLDDNTFLARFQREARMVARLEHPNIVPIYDFSEHEGRPYLVMKFIEGETLKARMERGVLSPTEMVRVVEVVGGALAYAHRQNVLHRDVKPSNVLLAADGGMYLADFGLARMAISGESSLTTDRLVGTPQYISPEQAQSKPNLDARTDIYSLGVMCYEMVVGRVPFNADTPFAIIHDHIYTPLPLPRKVNPQVSEAMERVLLKALAKNPADRFQDVTAFVQAFQLAAGASALPTRVAPPAAIDIATEVAAPAAMTAPKKGFPWKVVALIAGVLMVALFVLGMLINSGRNARQQVAAQTETAAAVMVATAENPQLNPDALKEAYRYLDESVTAYFENDLGQVQVILEKMRTAAARNWEFYRDAIRMYMDKKIPLLAAMLILPPDRPQIEYPGLPVEFAHEVVYLAAGDPLAADFFIAHQDDPLFVVALARRELYFGDPGRAQESNAKVLQNQVQSRRFPETELLEVEIYIVLQDLDLARRELDDLRSKTMPEWVRVMADSLQKEKLTP